MEQALTIAQVCEILNVSPPTVYRRIRQDKTFKTYLVGGRRRMRPSALAEWIRQQEEKERVA